MESSLTIVHRTFHRALTRVRQGMQIRPMFIETNSSPAAEWRVLSDRDLRTVMQLARGTRRIADAARA